MLSQSQEPAYQKRTESLAQAASTALDEYDYEAAIDNSLNLIQLALPHEDYYNLNHGYNILGITYEILEDTIRAEKNYLKSLKYARAVQNDTLLYYAYNNLGNIFSANPATVETGLDYYQRAIEIATALPESLDIIIPVVNIGWTYLENRKYKEAFPYLQKASELFEKAPNPAAETDLQTLYGIYYTGKKNFSKAQEHFEVAVNRAEQDSLLVEGGFAHEEFAKMLFAADQHKAAYEALKKHQEYQKRVFQQEKELQRKAAYEKFETEVYKRDLAAARLQQQFKDEVLEKTRQVSLIMIISLIIMGIFLVLFVRSNRIRKKLIAELKAKNFELEKSKEEAERLSSMKTRFFSTVSHELRTPLYGVVGLAALLLEDNKNLEQKEDLKSLKFSADYLLALINDVLQMNKMESNLVHLENNNFNMQELLCGIVSSFEKTRNLNKNQIELQIDPEIPKNLIGDSMRLSQIMMNLIGNAVKFTEAGIIWIKAQKKKCPNHECYIYFEVGDTGQGIPENKQQEIFEEFSQLQSNNMSYQGTGLGLPIVKKLLLLFDSEIHLESRPGKGAIFNFEIGFQKGQEEAAVELQLPAEIPISQQQRKVLIVDDNRINQVVTQRILEKRDFICESVASGEEAIERLKQAQFDVVLMDVNMPGMNGMQTTAEIRKTNASIPVIALTAVEVGEMKKEILSTGMDDIINKPYDVPEFFATILRNLPKTTPEKVC